MTRQALFGAAGAIAMMIAATPAAAHLRHRHAAVAPAVSTAPRTPFSFYPETIEGGSPGNLAFNNQIRKLRDPLNANGAGD